MEAENLEELEQVIQQQQPAALLMEPVLGSGGVVPLTETFIKQAAGLSNKHGMLFCMDEIQTGMGRTGELFAYMHTDIKPDVILFAKGVGGGLPLGGLIVKPALNDLFFPGDHGTTFAPSPLSSALGLTVLKVLNTGVLEQSKNIAAVLHQQLAQLQMEFPEILGSFRGKGMMIGLPTKLKPEEVKALQQIMIKKGILIDITQKTIIRLLPPLTLTQQEANHFIQVFREAMQEVNGGLLS